MAAGMTWSGARLRPQSSPRKRVLVVDENPQDLRGCVDTLTRAGYHVSGCSSVEEGTRSLEAGVFGLIIVSQGTVAFEGRPLLERSIEMNRATHSRSEKIHRKHWSKGPRRRPS